MTEKREVNKFNFKFENTYKLFTLYMEVKIFTGLSSFNISFINFASISPSSS